MQTQFKAIETAYKGYRFRSRLEARWAVFFDYVGIRYEYEKEGFSLGDGLYYLPDFWLPEARAFAEIKGERPEYADADAKASRLAEHSKAPVYMFCGNPWPGEYLVRVFVDGGFGPLGHCFESDLTTFAQCSGCGLVKLILSDGKAECSYHTIGTVRPSNPGSEAVGKHGLQWKHPRIIPAYISDVEAELPLFGAYRAAREARFEHGQRG